jgi:cobalt-zinc-cadmium efflux system protein
MSWAAVLIGSAIMYFTKLTVIDPILSVAIACFVLFNVFKNIKQTLPVLLQGTAAEIEQIANVRDLHIWSLDEEYNVSTVHVTVKEPLPMAQVAELKEKIRAVLKEEDSRYATIEFETLSELCVFVNCVQQ